MPATAVSNLTLSLPIYPRQTAKTGEIELFYWADDPNVFMEVTHRTNIGDDLEAPLSGRGGVTASYVLVPEVRASNVIRPLRQL
jgi:hypothetical protein